jgi:hypothetical protein
MSSSESLSKSPLTMPSILIVQCLRISITRSGRRSHSHLYTTRSPTKQLRELTPLFFRQSRKHSKVRRRANRRWSCQGQYGVITLQSAEPPTSPYSGYCSEPRQYYRKKSITTVYVQQRRHLHTRAKARKMTCWNQKDSKW